MNVIVSLVVSTVVVVCCEKERIRKENIRKYSMMITDMMDVYTNNQMFFGKEIAKLLVIMKLVLGIIISLGKLNIMEVKIF